MSAIAARTVPITTSAGRPLSPPALVLGSDTTFPRGVGVGDALATAGRRTATGFPCASTAMRTQASPAGCPDRQGQCRVVRQGTDVLPGNREEGGCRHDCVGAAGSCVPSRTIGESGGGAGLDAVTRPQTAMRRLARMTSSVSRKPTQGSSKDAVPPALVWMSSSSEAGTNTAGERPSGPFLAAEQPGVPMRSIGDEDFWTPLPRQSRLRGRVHRHAPELDGRPA